MLIFDSARSRWVPQCPLTRDWPPRSIDLTCHWVTRRVTWPAPWTPSCRREVRLDFVDFKLFRHATVSRTADPMECPTNMQMTGIVFQFNGQVPPGGLAVTWLLTNGLNRRSSGRVTKIILGLSAGDKRVTCIDSHFFQVQCAPVGRPVHLRSDLPSFECQIWIAKWTGLQRHGQQIQFEEDVHFLQEGHYRWSDFIFSIFMW